MSSSITGGGTTQGTRIDSRAERFPQKRAPLGQRAKLGGGLTTLYLHGGRTKQLSSYGGDVPGRNGEGHTETMNRSKTLKQSTGRAFTERLPTRNGFQETQNAKKEKHLRWIARSKDTRSEYRPAIKQTPKTCAGTKGSKGLVRWNNGDTWETNWVGKHKKAKRKGVGFSGLSKGRRGEKRASPCPNRKKTYYKHRFFKG